MPENLKLNTFLQEFHSDCTHSKCGFGFYGFAFGQSPFHVPQQIQKSLIKNASKGAYAPVQGVNELCNAISEYNKRHLERYISSDRIHIVHYGLDMKQFAPLSERVNGDIPVIFSIGRLVEKKGFPYLIQACRILSERGYNFECEIVGDGPQTAGE